MGSWERIEERGNRTLWQGRDAEGRRQYATSLNWNDGTSVEPSGWCVYASKRAAWTAAKEDAS